MQLRCDVKAELAFFEAVISLKRTVQKKRETKVAVKQHYGCPLP